MEKIKISTNWSLIHGKDIAESSIIKLCQNEDDLEKIKSASDLDDIVSFERSIQLQSNDNENTEINCEISFNIFPKFTVHTINIVTDCQKAEVFIGSQKEYLNTICGHFEDEIDGIQIYRHNIESFKHGALSTLTVKFIPKVTNLWIYGIQIILVNNINPLFSNNSSINLDNVQNIIKLSNQKLSPNAERCKTFVENYILASQRNTNSLFNLNVSNSNNTNLSNLSCIQNLLNSNAANNYENPKNINKMEELKLYIDYKILETEKKIIERISDFETKQNDKLQQIFELLLKK